MYADRIRLLASSGKFCVLFAESGEHVWKWVALPRYVMSGNPYWSTV